MSSLNKTNYQTHKPLVICGPSGVGKGTLIKELMSAEPDTFGFSVSHTTRKMRPGEEDGVHYNFVSHDEFLELVDNNAFIEHLQYNNNRYGTSKQALHKVQQQRLICILDIAISSAQKIKNMHDMDCNFLFITTSGGLDTLAERLRGRKTEKEDQIAGRLKSAQKELEFVEQNPQFFDYVLINEQNKLSEALQNFRQIVYKWYCLSNQANINMYPQLPSEELHVEYCADLRKDFEKISINEDSCSSRILTISSDSLSDSESVSNCADSVLSDNDSSDISVTTEATSAVVAEHSPNFKMSAVKYKDRFIFAVNALPHYNLISASSKAETIWSFNQMMLKSFTTLYVYSDIFVL